MQVKKNAIAGTMESSDIMVMVRPQLSGIDIDLKSSVEKYYGESIRKTIGEVLQELGVEGVVIKAVDHGALDCTIRARVKTAVKRAMQEEGEN